MAEEKFTSAAAALDTFKRGSRGPRWHAAAQYLIRNANHDTRMLLDYAIEQTRVEMGGAPRKRPLHRGWLIAGAAGGLLLTGAFIALFAYIFQNLRCG